MQASPGGEIIILVFAFTGLLFVLYREFFNKNKKTWRLGLSDFLARPMNESNEKSIAALALGFVMIIVFLILLIQRVILIWG